MMNNYRITTTFVFCFFAFYLLQAQKNENATQALIGELELMKMEREDRISDFLSKNPKVKKILYDNKQSYDLIDVVDGHPIYMGTHNAESARSIGADELYSGGNFGLDIAGQGMRVGVWDQRVPRQQHVEFEGQITINEAGEVSDHATHVLGTIIAKGVDTRARGIAHKADGVSYDWNDDASEMLTEASTFNLLVSNHSYGPLAGWVPSLGQWFGDASVSTSEDYKFGYYDSRARAWDAIIVQHPYYTICKSAGNDRGDSGDGTFPPDGSFDIIASYATAKNIITVGAVEKTSSTDVSPSQIRMSSFSSWGPTDDGRVKPDICAPGVNVYSPTSGSNNEYASFNGTSMATPVVSGSCVLLQQLQNELTGEYMWSSSLKGLIIHTALECGAADGPDYQYGWGMINVNDASQFLINNDGINNIIIQDELNNEEEYVLELDPIAGEKITATLVWTDQPGTVPPRVLDPEDLILVNDLDMRIVNEAGDEVMPWVLNPATPGIAATRGDNFRDNVEKIEFENPEQRKYFIKIRHKGQLTGNSQPFSLLVSYESENSGLTNLYWIGDSGNWNDPDNWSLTSGGMPANIIPSDSTKVIFDENSFSGAQNYAVNLINDVNVGSIIWLSKSTAELNLNGFTLQANTTSQLTQENLTINNGHIGLMDVISDNPQVLSLGSSQLINTSLRVMNNGDLPWIVQTEGATVDSLMVVDGDVILQGNEEIFYNHIIVDGLGSNVECQEVNITGMKTLIVRENSDFTLNGNTVVMDGATTGNVQLNSHNVNGNLLINSGSYDLNLNNSTLKTIIINSSQANINSSFSVDSFSIIDGQVNVVNGGIIEVNNGINMEATLPGSMILESNNGSASIFIGTHRKFCFDDLIIRNIDLSGEASVSVGLNSNIENSANWFQGSCENLLFSNFEIMYPCAKGLTYIVDRSEGSYSSRNWIIDGEAHSSTDDLVYFSFPTSGTKSINLSVSNGEVTSSYSRDIEIVPNSLDSNWVIRNSTQLASFKAAESYQWFKNGEPIAGQTNRTYPYQDETGVFFVLTFEGGCNRKSEEFTSVNTTYEEIEGVKIFPIPMEEGILYIDVSNPNISSYDIRVSDLNGKIVYISKISSTGRSKIDLTELLSGNYFLEIISDSRKNNYKIIKL